MGERGDSLASAASEGRSSARWSLVGDALVFQLKLVLDGLRDVVFSPLSIALVVYGLLFGGDRPEQPFRRLLQLGRRSDAWIRLFGERAREPGEAASVDDLIEPLETALLDRLRGSPEHADLVVPHDRTPGSGDG